MELSILKFKDMPFTFQRSIVIYGGEDGIVDWTVIPSFAEANKINWFDEESVQIWIDDYSKVYADKEFKIGEVNTEELKTRIMQNDSAAGFDSFEKYHEWYEDDTDHGDSVFPIVLSDCEERIEDGWHRFHSYVHKEIKCIPFVEYI